MKNENSVRTKPVTLAEVFEGVPPNSDAPPEYLELSEPERAARILAEARAAGHVQTAGEMLSTSALARRLDVDRRSLDRLVKEGKLTPDFANTTMRFYAASRLEEIRALFPKVPPPAATTAGSQSYEIIRRFFSGLTVTDLAAADRIQKEIAVQLEQVELWTLGVQQDIYKEAQRKAAREPGQQSGDALDEHARKHALPREHWKRMRTNATETAWAIFTQKMVPFMESIAQRIEAELKAEVERQRAIELEWEKDWDKWDMVATRWGFVSPKPASLADQMETTFGNYLSQIRGLYGRPPGLKQLPPGVVEFLAIVIPAAPPEDSFGDGPCFILEGVTEQELLANGWVQKPEQDSGTSIPLFCPAGDAEENG